MATEEQPKHQRVAADLFVNDPPTLADMETLRAKMNELITALRR